MNTSTEFLEKSLGALLEALDPDLDRLQRLSPALAKVLVETSVSVLVLEHVLRKKGLVDRDEVAVAVAEAQHLVRQLASRGADA